MSSLVELNKRFNCGFIPLENFYCQVQNCDFKSANTARELLSHYRINHNKDKTFSSSCLYSQSCPHTDKFKAYSGLYKHMNLFHKDFISNI